MHQLQVPPPSPKGTIRNAFIIPFSTQRLWELGCKLDYMAIAILVVGSMWPVFHYVFYCHPYWKWVYIGVMTCLGIGSIFFVWHPYFRVCFSPGHCEIPPTPPRHNHTTHAKLPDARPSWTASAVVYGDGFASFACGSPRDAAYIS